MGRRRKNTFAKALGQLKSTKIDEKIQMLSERPTNSVMTYMTATPSTLNPDFVSSQRGQDSALSTIEPDFAQDDASENGRDTTGLFQEDGTPRVAMPPGDTSYILGPMAGMFYNYSSPWTRIGYIRQSDRKMVNLGSITGKLSDWDGSSNFTSYGQLTLAQAQWFKDVQKAPGQTNDPDTYNYRAFYPGPPSSSRDAFGRYYCVITGEPKSDPLDKVGEKEQIPGTGGKATADDNFAALLDRLRKGAKNIPWDEISKGLDIAMLAWDVAAVVGLLFPEPTTSALGAARLARHLRHFGKAKGLARGLKGMSVGATGLKRGGYQAIKGGAKHTGSRGILSGIGKKQVYSAPKVGKVGKSAWSPGTGASRYTKFQSNPLVQGKADPGGVVGSIVPGGARKLNIIEPQAAVNPDTFSKGVRLFRKVMGGQYSKSATASKIRKQAQAAGFGGGKANVPFKNLLKQSFDISGNLIVEVMTTAVVTDPITNLDPQTESNVNSKAQQFAAKVPDKDKNKWADLLGQWSIENTTGDQRYAAEIASINMENGGSIGALLGAGYLLWEGGKLIFNGMDDLKHKIFDPNKQEHLDRILEEVSLRTDNPTLMSIDEIDDAMYIIATRDEDWTVNKFDQLIEQDVDANRITQEISDAQDLLWTMRGTEYPGSPYLEPEFVRLKEDHWNKWDIMQANGGYEGCRDKYWEGGKEIIESWYKAAILHSDYHEKYVVPVWYKAIKDKEKEIEDMYASMTPIIERLKVDFVTAWQQENKLKFGDQYVAGVYGDAGMVDIDGRGWFVTPGQLFKMNDSPGNYNLSPREIRLIRGWVQNLRASLNPYGTPTETDVAVASWEKDWKKKKKKDDEEAAALQVASFTLRKGPILTESRKTSILKNLKNPVVIPETKQKSYKVKPKIRGLNSAIISKPVETPKEYQPKGGRNLWGQFEYDRNVRQSQERKNEVLELVGEGEHAFNYMLNDSKAMNAQQLEKFWGLHPELYSYFYNGKKFKATRKEALDGDFLVFLVDENGEKSNILQSELNEKLAEEDDRKALEEYNKLNPKSKEPISFEKDYLFKKAYQKLKKEVDYKDKPAKMGYPNDPPPKMVNDRHPDFGKRPGTTMFNKLDPQSAAAMPKQDDPTIDAKVQQAKDNPKIDGPEFRRGLEDKIKKQRKEFNQEGFSDWRSEIEIPDQELVEDKKNFFKRVRKIKLDEAITNSTANAFQYQLEGSDTDHVVVQTGYTGDGDINDFTYGNAEREAIHHGGEFTAFTAFTSTENAPDPQNMGTSVRSFGGQDGDGKYDLSPTTSDSPTGATDSMGNFWPGYTGGLRGTHFRQNYSSFPYTASGGPTNEGAVGFEEEDEPQEGILERLGSAQLVGTGFAGNAGVPRILAMKPVDTTEMDTFSLNWFTLGLIVTDSVSGSGSYGQKFARDDFKVTGQGDGVYLYYWAGDKPGAKIYGSQMSGWGTATKNYTGWRPINRKWDGTLDPSVDPHIIPDKPNPVDENGDPLVKGDNFLQRGPYRGQTFFNNKLTLPEWCRGKDMRFMLIQKRMSQGAAYNRWGLTSVRFQRRAPMSVVVPLDDPRSVSFVRLGQSPNEKTSPKQRKKKVENILKASKSYVNKVVGDPFPGTDAKIGEAQGTNDKPYVPQQWNDKRKEFGDVGTLDQQKDKFVSKDVKLAPTYSQVQKAKKKK